ncbi:LuxR C-terminal-related transcriptional regulator [Microbacterium sp. CIAB417]|uniref:helix-turn-helix transcriptional regulator n=1 Tax=Microbacterium sp. CIAB417 TaxID=2860287 RepID=UPI001FAC095B|nr:LuxR C-terminal-related transcriptional regulator [Microbacterium sp. CIAB417]
MIRVPEDAGTAAVAGVVDRPRLYRILDAPGIRLCVIQGPSGIGKTTLLRSWALQQPDDQPRSWIALGSGIGSRQAFWQHVVATARRLGTLPEEAAGRVGGMLGDGADPVDVAIDLLTGAGAVTLILDAYEHLGDAMAEIDQDLVRLVAAVPAVRLLITTRSHTALAELALQDAGATRIITMTDLAFTEDEVGTLIAEQTGVDDPRIVRSILRSTHGYALTVRAATLALAHLGRIPHVGTMEWDAVMAAKLEAQLPDPEAVRFVTAASVPPYVDVELATRLTGHLDAGAVLDMLERNGFGRWIPYARNRPVFQFVETIRDSFRSRASDDTEGFLTSCVTTALWLRENDDVDQALLFAIEGRAFDLADGIYVQVVTTNPDSYITDRFLPSLRTVPETVLSERPMLAFGLGLALTAHPLLRSQAPRIFRIAVESSARPSYIEPSVDAFTLAAMRAIARRLALSFRDSAEAGIPAARLIDEIDPAVLAHAGDHVGTVLRQLSYSLLQGGRIEEGLAAMTRSVTLCTSQTARNYSIAYAAGGAAFTGDLVHARSHLAAIDRDAWPQELRRSYMTGLGLVAEAYLLLDALDFAAVIDLLRGIDTYMPLAEFWPFHTAVSVVARHGLGQGRAAADRVTAALAAPFPPPGVGDNVATEHLLAVLAHVRVVVGDARSAAGLLDGQPTDSVHLASARIAVLLAAAQDAAALREARAALEFPGHTARTQAATQTFAAVAALRRGQDADAWDWLGSASVIADTHGARAHVALLPVHDRSLLVDFARRRGSTHLQRYLDVPSLAASPRSSPSVTLTPREGAVLEALAEHGSIREIAAALVVSPHTVKTQLQGIYRKLGVSSRHSAVAVARDLGLLGSRPHRVD